MKLKIGAYFLGLLMGIQIKGYDYGKAQDLFERYAREARAAGAQPRIDIHRAKTVAFIEMPASLIRLQETDPASIANALEFEHNTMLMWEKFFTPEFIPHELFEYWRDLLNQAAR
jgi:hypothetical protein